MMAKVMYGEARGVYSVCEQAAVCWCILNRADAWDLTIEDVILMPNQVCCDPTFPTVDDYGRDLLALAQDVVDRWENEFYGDYGMVGRVLPDTYLWYGGDGERNYFRDSYTFDSATIWDWSMPNPYES